MIRTRLNRSPVVRVVGYALWADALLTLMLTAAASWFAVPHQHMSTLLKAETVGWLRARPSLPPTVVDEFIERGTVTDETFAHVSAADRWDLQDKLDLYRNRAAREAVFAALAGFADGRMWWGSAALLLVGGVLVRRRPAWICNTCGATSTTPGPRVGAEAAATELPEVESRVFG